MDESLGSAIQENERYMESLEARTNQLKATFQDLANNVIDNQLVKSLISLANEGLELLNTDLGTTLTQIALLSGLGWGTTSLLKAGNFVKVAVGQFGKFNETLTKTGSLIKAFHVTSLPVIAGISALLILLPKFIDYWRDLHPSLETAEQDMADVESKLAVLESIPWADRTTEINREIVSLQEAKKELQDYIDKKKEANATKLTEAFEEKYTGLSSRQTYQMALGQGSHRVFVGEALTEAEAISQAAELLRNAGVEVNRFNQILDAQTSKWTAIEEYLEVVNDQYMTAIETLQQFGTEYENYTDQLSQGTELTVDDKEAIVALQNQINTAITDLIELRDATGGLNQEQQQQLTYLQSLQNGFEDTNKKLYDSQDLLESVANGYSLNNSQAKSLIASYPQLSSAVEENNGVFSVNIDKLVQLWEEAGNTQNALVDLAKAEITFSETEIDVSKQMMALQMLAAQAGLTGSLVAYALTPEAMQKYIHNQSTYLGVSAEQAAQNYIDAWLGQIVKEPTGTGNGTTTGGKSRVEKANDAWKEQLELLKDRQELLEKSGATEEEQVAQMRLIQDAIHAQAEKYRDMGLSEEHEYLRELGILWWDYEKQIEEVYDNATEAAEKAAEEAQEAWKEALEAQQTQLEETINKYEVAFDYMVSQIEKEIELLEEEKKVEEEYWDNRIAALETANDEMEHQLALEEAQEALAKARSTKVLVYKDGRYQYISDIEQVSQASANLDKIKREETLRKEVETLERLKEKALEAIDDQIEGWEKYKEEWGSVVTDYQEEQDKLLAEQVLGIELENDNWMTRLDNLESFVEEYRAYLDELNDIQKQLQQIEKPVIQKPTLKPGVDFDPVTGEGLMSDADIAALKAAGDAYNEAKARGDEAGMAAAHAAAEAIRAEYGYTGGTTGGEFEWLSGSGGGSINVDDDYDWSKRPGWEDESNLPGGAYVDDSGDVVYPEGHPGAEIDKDNNGYPDSDWLEENGAPSWVVESAKDREHANGTLNAPGGISLVGERGPELRVLNPGDGIIPADITKNLWAWGSMTPASMISALSGGFGLGGQQIVIQNLNLPGVRDGNDFVQYMRNNFWTSTVQFAAT